MPHTTQNPPRGVDEPSPEMPALPERRGCLFALSQPPLMLFLAVIGALLGITGAYDLFLL
ncbi:hypothetical protein [Streptomyces gossypii]|uniref:hypothetical protein n=1 Tax=Streptomyces gossypii TaxID=2883101 RepID=UPI0035CCD129